MQEVEKQARPQREFVLTLDEDALSSVRGSVRRETMDHLIASPNSSKKSVVLTGEWS